MSAVFLALPSSRDNITTSGQKNTQKRLHAENITWQSQEKKCLFQQFMSSIIKVIKMHHFDTFMSLKSSIIPLFLCQESCTVKILCAYSVTLLLLLPLHGNFFANFLSSPLVAILPHFLTKTPVSLKLFSFPKKHQASHTPWASSLTALPLLQCNNPGEAASYFSIHSGCCSFCWKKKRVLKGSKDIILKDESLLTPQCLRTLAKLYDLPHYTLWRSHL